MIPGMITKIDHHCEDFIEVARRYNSVIEKHAGVDLPGSEPHIHITSSPYGEQIIHFRLFCPTDRAIHLEQDIRCDFMYEYESRFAESTTEADKT